MLAEPRFIHSQHFKNFWEVGNGKQLLEWANTKINPQKFHQFAHLYYEVDFIGDNVVKETYLRLPFHEANSLINKYSESKITLDEQVPENMKKLFLQLQEIPKWFDENLANIGARFCMRTGTNALIILRDFTLMGGYDFAYLNKPLIFTAALKKRAVKRLKDTLEFWVNVTRENGLKINSEAYKLIVKTRLMHSYARLKIKENSHNWDYENWGEPINSWDMIATYTGFSLVFMHGLKKLGIIISDEEEKGVFHLWKYIGHLLGIPYQFLPENKKEAVEQLYLWSATQDKADLDSAQLAKALLNENLENTIYKYLFQRKLLMNLHQSMNWFLLDKEISERLKIPRASLSSIFPRIVIQANKISQKIFDLNNPEKYHKLVEEGNKQQMKVLQDYIKHAPKDFQY